MLVLTFRTIVLTTTTFDFEGIKSGGVYIILLVLSAILIAILIYIAITLLGDND